MGIDARRLRHGAAYFAIVATLAAALVAAGPSARLRAEDATPALDRGQRVFSAGHSFHVFVPGILRELAREAKIADHKQIGTQSIGGSRVVQHWDREDEKNQAKQALGTGQVDVLTLSPIYLPDAGIENFAKLAFEKNPQVRVTVQEFWLPYDVYAPNYQKARPTPVDRNARTRDELRKEHGAYFEAMDAYVTELNRKFERPVLFVVPVGQATVALREKIIAKEAPGLTAQNDLFTDAIGHATPPLQALCAYCHYAVIYRRSPVGLPMPGVLKRSPQWGENVELNQLLQELAWDAVTQHPLSGVRVAKSASKSVPQ